MRIVASVFVLWGLASAQTSEEGIRQLWNSQFLAKRPPAKKPAPSTKPAVYKPVVSAAKAAPASPNDTLLGLTLWRLRRPLPADDPSSRLLIVEEQAGSNVELVPERLEAETPLAEGDRVRLTVEIPRTGYLYVIDREQYADASVGPPYLIYPNYKTRQGDNAVAGGRIVEIPDQRDNPNHFRLRRSRPDQVAELLSFLVTAEPLADLNIGREPLRIPEEQFRRWEKQYGVQAERFELSGGAGAAYTKAEKEAGAGGDNLLTQDDPFPQTLYRVSAKPGEPMLLHIPVKIRK